MSMRYTLREGINRHKDHSKSSPTVGRSNQFNIEYMYEQLNLIEDARLQVHGFIIVLYGSFVSAFGDLAIKYFI